MGQAVHIHLGGEAGNVRPDDVAFWFSGDVEVSYLPDGTPAGRSAVLIAARDEGGKLVGIEITGRNFMAACGAVRGKMVESGEIEVRHNPGIVMHANEGSGVVSFATEAPLQSWDYTADEADKFCRMLNGLVVFARGSGTSAERIGELMMAGGAISGEVLRGTAAEWRQAATGEGIYPAYRAALEAIATLREQLDAAFKLPYGPAAEPKGQGGGDHA